MPICILELGGLKIILKIFLNEKILLLCSHTGPIYMFVKPDWSEDLDTKACQDKCLEVFFLLSNKSIIVWRWAYSGFSLILCNYSTQILHCFLVRNVFGQRVKNTILWNFVATKWWSWWVLIRWALRCLKILCTRMNMRRLWRVIKIAIQCIERKLHIWIKKLTHRWKGVQKKWSQLWLLKDLHTLSSPDSLLFLLKPGFARHRYQFHNEPDLDPPLALPVSTFTHTNCDFQYLNTGLAQQIVVTLKMYAFNLKLYLHSSLQKRSMMSILTQNTIQI